MNPTPIKPTVGRVVWYFRDRGAEPLAATIAYVVPRRVEEAPHLVNLTVHSDTGETFPAIDVFLHQPGEPLPGDIPFCEWMPYQLGQAAKTAALEAAPPQSGRPDDPRFPPPVPNRFDYIAFDPTAQAMQQGFKDAFRLVETMLDGMEPGRYVSTAMTHLEIAYAMVGKAVRDDQIRRNGVVPVQEGRGPG